MQSACPFCYKTLIDAKEPASPPPFVQTTLSLRNLPELEELGGSWRLTNRIRKDGKWLLFYEHSETIPGVAKHVVVKCSASTTEFEFLNLLLGRIRSVARTWNPRVPYVLPYHMARHCDGAATHIVMPNCGIALGKLIDKLKLLPASELLGLAFMIAFTLEALASLGCGIDDLHDENFVVHKMDQQVTLRFSELEPTPKGTLLCSSWISRTHHLVFMLDGESVRTKPAFHALSAVLGT